MISEKFDSKRENIHLTLLKRLVIISIMETNLAIDITLLEHALQIGGMKAENETINLALEEFIKRRIGENVISVFNTVEYDESYNYKKLRGKR
jgi:hypothetical protein